MSGILPTDGHRPQPNTAAAPADRVPMLARDPSPALREAAGRTITATAVGRDSQGHLLLRTDRGVLALATTLNPPRGSEVLVQLRATSGGYLQAYILQVREPGRQGATAAPPPAAGAAPTRAGAALPAGGSGLNDPAALTRIWPALEQALATLARTQPQAGSSAAPLVPQPGPAFVPALLSVLALLAGGDIRQWLGREGVQALSRAGQEPLLHRLESDLAQLQRFARDAGDGFRLFLFPVAHGETVHPMRLFVRRHEDDGGEDTDLPTRFVAEVEFDRLGEIQVDGLAQRGRLDLILRSRAPLDPDLRADLDALVQSAARHGGFAAGLHFAAGGDWHFLPVADGGGDGNGRSVLV